MKDFDEILPAIWIVFGGSYLNHSNAPKYAPDHREQLLVDLLSSFLKGELLSPATKQLYDSFTQTQLVAVYELLRLWSEDLTLIYQIREEPGKYIKILLLALRFLKRVTSFKSCTIIPNGLISAKHTLFNNEYSENVCLGILKKQGSHICWTQVDPGSAYHQHCDHIVGEKSNAYLKITGIDPNNITTDWLSLLIGLKAVHCKFNCYKNVSLYECLLSHLNGKVVFRSEPDEGFVVFSNESPAHTWQVIDQSFRYFLQHFLGAAYQVVYRRLLTNFKLFLMKKTLAAYQDRTSKQIQQCHFLLQEMCRDVAQQALDQGNEEQKECSFQLIKRAKAAIEHHWSQKVQLIRCESQLNVPQILSLSFTRPNVIHHSHFSSNIETLTLRIDPVFVKPNIEDDIIDYLQKFELNFIKKLISAKDLPGTALLSHGIEELFIDYLANTDILDRTADVPFSRDDIVLASTLQNLGAIYFGCQSRLTDFLSELTYEPQFYAKNVTIQFFVYAAIAALNFRDPNIGPLLVNWNLDIATLSNIIPHLVIDDSRWMKVLLAVKVFFTQTEGAKTLFQGPFCFMVQNNANDTNTDVSFAYQLIQNYPCTFAHFSGRYRDYKDEKLNHIWSTLVYKNTFLPSLYFVLSKVAYFAKVSLTGFHSYTNANSITADWSVKNTTESTWNPDEKRWGPPYYYRSEVSFKINNYSIFSVPSQDHLASFSIKSSPRYQRFVTRRDEVNPCIHYYENEIIASQDEKPETMGSLRYMQLGFLQSEPWVKLERLYIALKKNQLDCSCHEECILIKQTLFEVSEIIKSNDQFFSLLQWTACYNPKLLHAFGSLCIEKACAMRYRLTQHSAIGDLLLVALRLLSFYPPDYKSTLIEGIMNVYSMLKDIIAKPPADLSNNTLLYLNAYLLITVQANPQVLETEILTILKALVAIHICKVKGSTLNNSWLLQLHIATFNWCSKVEHMLDQHPALLNALMLNFVQQWDQSSVWQKSPSGLLFASNDYAVKPLLGCIYFRNQPIMGLPDCILGHKVFKEYLGNVNFLVINSFRRTNYQEIPCFESVDRTPQLRLTLIRDALLIEELIDSDYQRYIPAQELLGNCSSYPCLLSESPQNREKLSHWLCNDESVLVKDKQRQVIFKWDLSNSLLYSLQHEGYVVPWEKLPDCFFKTWLERIELSVWIELIAKCSSIRSLNFPRLCLNFNYKDGQFFSKQVHGYVIAKEQHLNTLHGFSSYVVLKLKEETSVAERIKVIIPYRKVISAGPFYVKTTTVDREAVQSPAYFVYDYDLKMGLLKGHSIRAQLYLALVYFRSASLDDHDASHCNAYHLAREILESCWKDQPFDEVELNIIEQLLDVSKMRCEHSHLIAIYLKVLSLLRSSLQREFLFVDKTTQRNKEKSDKLLKSCEEYLPRLIFIYLQNKSTISERIRLSSEELKNTVKLCSLSSSSNAKNNSYNSHYRQFFHKDKLISTPFLSIFIKYVHTHLNFGYDMEGVNFSSGFNGILIDRFRLVHFITLYKLAKASPVSLCRYRYFLHHLLIRAQINYERFPKELVFMLARALLLVAESPESFPDAPTWFDAGMSVDLSIWAISKDMIVWEFPSFYYQYQKGLTQQKNEEAERRKRMEDDNENNQIWFNLAQYDLDSQGVPLFVPKNRYNFTLEYENHINFRDNTKRQIVREIYLKVAYNHAMCKFFVSVLKKCDELKYASEMGWMTAPFVHNTITVAFTTEEECITPTPEPASLVKWAISQKPLINMDNFFIVDSQHAENSDFLFESQLKELLNGYQHQFYSELKDSWLAFTNETIYNYSWLNNQSANELESVLRRKFGEIHEEAKQLWVEITNQFKQRSNCKFNNFFALRWYSGHVRHYNKRDILRLLIEPHKLSNYNPDCLEKKDDIIGKLLRYVTLEINSAKVVRVLALIEQHKKAQEEPEKFSVLQSLVRCLQENLDPESYRYPHWFLFQFENDIIVRDNQRELIIAMLNQTEKAMYQLNMGEGKSSVILPLLSYNLANGEQLLRINVLSALLTTMHEFLRQRFSGLIQKRVYSLPFNRDTDISTESLKVIYETLLTCKNSQHILLVTPEHRLCLQLKIRELMLEHQQQIGATDIFSWETYRQRVHRKTHVYEDLLETETETLLREQDLALRICLCNDGYIDSSNCILKVPPRGQGYEGFVRFKDTIKNKKFREWSCLKAAYRELLYNSTSAYKDCTEKLELLTKIGEVTAIDLLDESDEILRHGTELNYTMGDKRMFDGGELRWQIPQFFIRTMFCDPDLREVITAGKADGFTMINPLFSSQGGVPFVQLLNESYYETAIKPLLINKFFQENSTTLRKYACSKDKPLIQGEKSSLSHYIAGKLEISTEKKILDVLADKGVLKDKILIAKGWLSHQILFHVFNAKYRVRYGLNLNAQGHAPKQIAIPFFGKDAPSPRSEFSHPDVMLGFTIISYLYQGLNQTQLKNTLNKLKSKFNHQKADEQLREWTNASRSWIERQSKQFPPLLLTSFQHIDLEDEQCLEEVHRYLSGNHLAIFFYLNQFVLLEEAMQYIYKISANAHSLVGYNKALGFSGTDDRKITMPFEIKSLCSKTQEGTNGKLLSVLTQERNSNYYSLEAENSVDLLKQLCEYAGKTPHCHALIDAGALITGLTNHAVAEFLLEHLPAHFLGILYFSDEGNCLTVLTKDKNIIALHDCYLDNRNLFAYLSDIHSRGTDINFPLNCHAILTIGMAMEKDKLMQSAMRLRQLAQKQSVSLWGTQVVSLAISRDNSVDVASINSREVIKWVARNTINRINADLYSVAIRKINFQFLRKAETWLKEAPTTAESLVQCCQEKQQFRLEDFYALSPKCENLADLLHRFIITRCKTFWQEFEKEFHSENSSGTFFHEKLLNKSAKNDFFRLLVDTCKNLQSYLQPGYVHNSLNTDQENEVEVEVQVEAETVQEQEVVRKIEERSERPEDPWDARLILQEDFITEAKRKKIIMPLKSIKDFIQVPEHFKEIIWHRDIYMTSNFIYCVKCEPNKMLDNYLRPVDIVLIHRTKDKSMAVLLSGQEASEIKKNCYHELRCNLLIHINDINGPTQIPVDSSVSKQEQKLLTIIKLFSGECQYESLKEVHRIAKRVGRIYPSYFTCPGVSNDDSEKLYGAFIKKGYLDFAGIMTDELLEIFPRLKSEECNPYVKKLHGTFSKLIIRSSSSLKSSHNVLWEWVGTRGRLKEYSGSALESILNPENELRCSQ